MANGNLDIIGLAANTIGDIFHFLNKLITGNGHRHIINIIFKHVNICIKNLEYKDSSNEYLRFIKQVGNVLYYKMPIGMSFKQIEKIHDVFESSLMAHVKITELKDLSDAHFSFTITENTV